MWVDGWDEGIGFNGLVRMILGHDILYVCVEYVVFVVFIILIIIKLLSLKI